MSVDAITSQLNNSSLNDSSANAGDKSGSAQNDAVLASAAEGRRLYIGNLAYATTEGELKDFFKSYLVETTSIPTNPRTSRPVGYAFVDVSTPSEAERAINELNGKSILDRKVSVQLARKPEPAAAEPIENNESQSRRGNANASRGRGRGRGRGTRGRGRGGRQGGDDANGGELTMDSNEVLPLTEGADAPAPAQNGTEAKASADKADKKSAPRPPKQRGPPSDGVPSKTKVMVANLPYEYEEEKLLAFFKDYQPVSAKIALRPIPRFMVKKLLARNEPRKGRGFGFVTLPSEELQQKACNELNGKEIDGREIAVKVAIDSPGKEDAEIIPDEQESGAAATATA